MVTVVIRPFLNILSRKIPFYLLKPSYKNRRVINFGVSARQATADMKAPFFIWPCYIFEGVIYDPNKDGFSIIYSGLIQLNATLKGYFSFGSQIEESMGAKSVSIKLVWFI
jgi:hypothetical protein